MNRLIEIIALTRGMDVLNKPPSKVPRRKPMVVLGTSTHKVRELDAKRAASEEAFDLKARQT
jgi:hypothetical protein